MALARDKEYRSNNRISQRDMNHSKSSPLTFEPDSVYLLFIARAGRSYPGVFHHNSGNIGRLAYAGGVMPEPRRSHRTVFLFEVNLKESKVLFPEPQLPAADSGHLQG